MLTRRETVDPPFSLDGAQEGTVLVKPLREALATLRLGLARGDPFLLLTGSAGTGKTTIVHRLLETLDPERYVLGGVFAPRQGEELWNLVVQDFGVRPPRPGASFLTLAQFLQRRNNAVREGVLVIDEAQALDAAALRELWQLAVPAAGGRPRLQVILVAQQLPPVVAELIQGGRAPPIGTRCDLRPLEAAETREFVRSRLGGGDAMSQLSFTDPALLAIHERSRGVLRRLGVLCDRIGMQLASQGRHEVSAEVVAIVDAQLRGEWSGSELSTAVPPQRAIQDASPVPRSRSGTIGGVLRAVPSARLGSASQADAPTTRRVATFSSSEEDAVPPGLIPVNVEAAARPQGRVPSILLAAALLCLAVVAGLFGLGMQRNLAGTTPVSVNDRGALSSVPAEPAAQVNLTSAPVSVQASTPGAIACSAIEETLGLCLATARSEPGPALAAANVSTSLNERRQPAACTTQSTALGLCDEH
jgi:general secretion pathway protein A